MKKIIQELENTLLKQMTFVILILIISIWVLYFFCIIDIKYSLTSTGAIFAFWYGYKKYERDKQIELIQNFRKMSFEDIRIDWHCKKVLYDKGFILPYIWKAIEREYLLVLKKHIGIIPIDNIKENMALAADIYISLSELSQQDETKEYFEKEISTKIIEYLESGKGFLTVLSGINKKHETERIDKINIIDKAILELKNIYKLKTNPHTTLCSQK